MTKPDFQHVRAGSLLATLFVASNLAAGQMAFLFFGWPDILRAPPSQIFAAFERSESAIRFAYYLWSVSWLLFFPTAVLVSYTYLPDGPLRTIAYGSSGACAVFHALGSSRWVISVPYLVAMLSEGHGSPPLSSEAVFSSFGALHTFVGTTIGEHLGNLLRAAWTGLIAAVLLRRGQAWLGAIGCAAATGLFLFSLEQLGGRFDSLGIIGVPTNLGWLGWFLALAWSRPDARVAAKSAAQPRAAADAGQQA